MLELDCVTVRYPGAATAAVDRLSLTVAPGEQVALVGPSGAGKTTLLDLANGLVRPTEGSVRVFGVDTAVLGHRRHRATRRRVGAVHQSFALVPPLRVSTNVAAGRLGSLSTLRALALLVRPRHDPDVFDALDRLGIADQRWKRVDQLSGGQQQRVAIARTLHQRPDIVLADEPVSSLDPARSKAALTALVDSVSADERRSMLVSLHDAPLALSHLARIVGVRDGRIAFDAPAREVTLEMLDELYEIEVDPDPPS